MPASAGIFLRGFRRGAVRETQAQQALCSVPPYAPVSKDMLFLEELVTAFINSLLPLLLQFILGILIPTTV